MNRWVQKGDVTLYEKDLAILRARSGWLSDSILELSMQQMEGHGLVCVSPSVTLWLRYADEEESLQSLTHHLRDACAIALAVSDHEDIHHVGGTHWSLLVVNLADRMAVHLDSGRSSANARAANFIRRRLGPLIGLPSLGFSTLDVAQQSNSYDCGLFVIGWTARLSLAMSRDGLAGLRSFIRSPSLPFPAENSIIYRSRLIQWIPESPWDDPAVFIGDAHDGGRDSDVEGEIFD